MSISQFHERNYGSLKEVDDMLLAREIIRNPNFSVLGIGSYLAEIEKRCEINLEILKTFCDSSLVFQSGKQHLKSRRAISDFLSAAEIKKWESKAQEGISELLANLENKKETDLLVEYADPIYFFLVGKIIGVEIADSKVFMDDLNMSKNIAEPLQSVKKIQKIQISISNIFKIVHEAYNNKENASSITLIQSLKKNAEFEDEKRIISLIVSLIIAAHTTTETLILILYHFLNNKSTLWEGAQKVEWLEKRIDGFIRLFPTTQYIGRKALYNTNIRATTFEAKTDIFIKVPGVNRDPLFTSEEELLAGMEERKCPFNHMSFGGGIHKCPGAELARMILIKSVSSLAIKFPNIKLSAQKLKTTQLFMIKKPDKLIVSIR